MPPPTRAPSLQLLRVLHAQISLRNAGLSSRPLRCPHRNALSTGGKILLTRRDIHTTPHPCQNSPSAGSTPTTSRGPTSDETTQTDFPTMDIFANTPPPATSIDACTSTGFHLGNGQKIQDAGILILGGEAFAWTPWTGASLSNGARRLINSRGQFDLSRSTPSHLSSSSPSPASPLALLDLLYPKPDLLILGLGPRMLPLANATRYTIADMGVRVEVQDTRNAAAQFNLLATERGVGSVGAAMIPIGWVEGRGLVG